MFLSTTPTTEASSLTLSRPFLHHFIFWSVLDVRPLRKAPPPRKLLLPFMTPSASSWKSGASAFKVVLLPPLGANVVRATANGEPQWGRPQWWSNRGW